jgi:hypothetical protein
MNTSNSNNIIHTNLPSLEDIKSWKILNIKHIPEWKKQNYENLNIRMQINKKPIYQALYFKDYIINWILDKNQLIIDALKIKEELIKKSNRVSAILDWINTDKWFKKITWLGIKNDKWNIMFYFRLSKNWETRSTSIMVDWEDFDNSFYQAVEKYLYLRKELWFSKIHVDEKNQLYNHINYYRNKYWKLKDKKLLKEEKDWLIKRGLITKEGRILSIQVKNNHLIYTNNHWNKFKRFITDSNILELIIKFILNNWLELNGDIHNWFKEQLLYYTQSYQKKLEVEKKWEENQKNSNLW